MNNPLIIALDVDSPDAARQLIRQLGDSVSFYKIGLELYAAGGVDFVREVLAGGNRVFLDLKFYDIPETVKRAVAQVTRLGVSFLTVHAVPQVMRAAMEGRGESELRILGVTVLTSLDAGDLSEMGHTQSPSELVQMRAAQAVRAGVDGLVCSPLELSMVRSICGPDVLLVAPGVRSAGADTGDQKRVATPVAALEAGANYLVIGRQVTRAAEPKQAVSQILNEIQIMDSRNL